MKNHFDNLSVLQVSTGYLLLDENPVPRRLILLGGTPPLMGQLPVPVADGVAQGVLTALGHDSVVSNNVVKTLLKIPVEDLLTRIAPGTPFLPVIDGDIIPEEVTVASLSYKDPAVFPGAKHIDSILLVNSKLDVSFCSVSVFIHHV